MTMRFSRGSSRRAILYAVFLLVVGALLLRLGLLCYSEEELPAMVTADKYMIGSDRKMYEYNREMPLIFIGGVPRSGTTLMRAMLDAHPDIRYLENVRRFGKIVKDEPMKPLEKAIWWTEYVLRHKGAKHLKGPIVPFYQRYLLDVFVFSVLLLVLLAFTVYSIFKLLNYAKKLLIRNKFKLN